MCAIKVFTKHMVRSGGKSGGIGRFKGRSPKAFSAGSSDHRGSQFRPVYREIVELKRTIEPFLSSPRHVWLLSHKLQMSVGIPSRPTLLSHKLKLIKPKEL